MRYDIPPIYGDKVKTECVINNVRLEYDTCGSGDLDESKAFYAGMTYIGSGTVYFINGKKNESEELQHYFIYKRK